MLACASARARVPSGCRHVHGDRATSGSIHAGRAARRSHRGGRWRLRVRGAGSPGAEHGCTGCNSYAEGAGSGLELSTLEPSRLGVSGARGLAASAAVLLCFFARCLGDRLNIAAATGHEHEDEGNRRANNTRNRDGLANVQAVSTHVHDEGACGNPQGAEGDQNHGQARAEATTVKT